MAVCVALAAVLLPAEGAQQDEENPVMKATTRLVQLNVVVLDKQGHPVRGLSQDDFQIFDDDSRQRIVHFAASMSGDSNEVLKQSPLVISNRPGSAEESRGVTVVLIDAMALDAPSGAPLELAARTRMATLAVVSFLKMLKPRETVALYAMRTDGMVVLHDFTEDQAVLVAAVKQFEDGGVRGKKILFDRLASGNRYMPGDRVESRRSETRAADTSEDMRVLADGFLGLAKHLEGLPGRKNLVWISSTFPTVINDFDPNQMLADRDAPNPVPKQKLPVPDFSQPESKFEKWRDFARSLSDANISVYPMDAQGLDTMNSASHFSGSSPVIGTDKPTGTFSPLGGPAMVDARLNNGAVAPPPAPNSAGSVGQWSAMEILADETGGRAVINSNALDQHLREIVEQGEASYQIGYYPGDKAWDGKYHQIAVKLAQQGMKVLCRKGYYAKDAPVTQGDTELRKVAKGVVESPGIGVTLNVSSNPLGPGPDEVVVKLDVHDLHFEQSGDRSNANLDMAFVQLGKDGRVVEGIKDHIALALLPQTYTEALNQGWLYPRSLWIEPNVEKMRVVVRDLATGAVGSVSVSVALEKRIK